jgi:NAD(P)-dependent dehydrogenase (short-subunit alcohol dehydrogenase family)
MVDYACPLDTEVHMEIFNAVAVVAGADTALGNAVAVLLEQRGARVAQLRTTDSESTAAATSQSQLSFDVSFTDTYALQDAFRQIEEKLGPPRILVNCHEYADRFPIAELDSAQNVRISDSARCEKVIANNLVGAFDVSRLFAASATTLPPLQDGERGVLINATSEAADDGAVNEAALAAATGALIGMTLPLARELGRYGIRTLSVVASDFQDHAAGDRQRAFSVERAFPERRGKPREFAELVGFLISNPMMNGTTIRLDGGGRMKSIESDAL